MRPIDGQTSSGVLRRVTAVNICVLVRVYNRLADLEVCLEAIRVHWRLHRYHVVVLSNGRRDGYPLPANLGPRVAMAVECDASIGHVAGTSRMLLEGIHHIPGDCDYTVLLEADTWVHTDSVLDRYLALMNVTGAVWASAEWVEKFQSLAVDCALVRSSFVRDHPEVFEFSAHAEYHVARHLADQRVRFLYMREHMPVHVPRVMRMFDTGSHGRFRCFPAGAMVTHHIEELPGGLAEKKQLANATLGRVEYAVAGREWVRREHRRLVWLQRLARLAPRSAWLRPKRRPPAAWFRNGG